MTVRLRILITVDDEEEPRETVEFPIPEPPSADFPGGGHWRWVGKLPRTRVDVSDQYTLAIYVIRRDSTHARLLERQASRKVLRRGVNRVPEEPAEPEEPKSRPRPLREAVRTVGKKPVASLDFPGDFPFGCTVCPRRFRTAQELEAHMRRGAVHRAAADKLHAAGQYPCHDCGRSFNRPNELGRHRKAAHSAKKAAPAGRKPKRTRARVARAAHRRNITVREAPVEAADQRFGRPPPVAPPDKPPRDEREEEARVEIAAEIMIATANGPEAVDMERAQRIAGIILRVFDGTDRATDGQLTGAEQADLHTLDGRMIRHEVLGQGRRAVHYWVYHPFDVTAPLPGGNG